MRRLRTGGRQIDAEPAGTEALRQRATTGLVPGLDPRISHDPGHRGAARRAWKSASKTPVRLRRQNRFQMLSSCRTPYSVGRARQVMLWSVKKWIASRKLRSSCPGSPPRLHRIKSHERQVPIRLGHLRQHRRLPIAGHAVIRSNAGSGILKSA